MTVSLRDYALNFLLYIDVTIFKCVVLLDRTGLASSGISEHGDPLG